ncbi:hypothetical protein RGQ15_21815 [Paracoccus sp. MBLB3053]|uniref:Transporter n=1 Tax=Paracoccus aurantius TaxID=3073814 RepID=A0ABU2HYP7_9RHOB|nr:hypothetical protein [Paracoccus sp. MBLB3053]MDS9470189.1 hypothetical protein [Paracoccus sp. MBLB3053]
MFRRASTAVTILALTATGAFAQSGEQDLSQAASDPTASLTAYLFQNFYTGQYHGRDDAQGNRMQFRMAIPYTLGGTNNIFRLTLPYVTDSPSGNTGLSDATVFNLTTFKRDWGRFGVGAVALLPLGADAVTADRWAIGPAAGFVAQADWGIWGLFNQNLIDIGGKSGSDPVNLSVIQPILNVSLDQGWSVGTSDMSVTYDWDEGEFVSLPLGIQVNKLVRFGTTPVQFGLSYEYNFYDETVAPEDTIGFTMKILAP